MNELTTERMIKAPELARRIDISIQAFTEWYRWKEENPDHPLAQYLPDYTKLPGGRRTRFWKESEIWKLEEFKKRLPRGRNGIMGKVTQKYAISNKDGKGYIKRVVNLLNKYEVDESYVDIIKEFLDEEFEKRVA